MRLTTTMTTQARKKHTSRMTAPPLMTSSQGFCENGRLSSRNTKANKAVKIKVQVSSFRPSR